MRVCKQIDYSAIFKIVLKMAEFPLTGYKLYCADVFARNTSLFCTIPTDFISPNNCTHKKHRLRFITRRCDFFTV